MRIIDTALVYEPARRRCDLAFDGTDLVLDDTPVTPVLTAVGLRRRARLDDEVPDARDYGFDPAVLNPRGGWCGDALDADGRLTGCRLWLLVRRKQDEATRLLAESALQEALEPLANARGWPIDLTVRWVRAGMLGWQVAIGRVRLSLTQAVA